MTQYINKDAEIAEIEKQIELGKDIARHFFEFGIKTRKEEVK